MQQEDTIEKSSIDFKTGVSEELYSDSNVPFKKSLLEKKLLRKINWVLLPFLAIILFIRTANANISSSSFLRARIIDTDTELYDIFDLHFIQFISFMVFQIPNNFLMQKIPISRYLGTMLFLWGIVICCAPLCKNYTQLAACHVFFGLFEASIFPSLLITLNSLYRRSEQSAAFGFLWVADSFTHAIYSLCIYGTSINGLPSLDSPFYIWGGLSIAIGLFTFFLFPSTPNSFMFKLNGEEKEIVKERVKDSTAIRVNEIKISHILESLIEPRFWFINIVSFLNQFHVAGLSFYTIYLISAFGLLALIGLILLMTLPDTDAKVVGLVFAWATEVTSLMLVIIIGVNVTGYSKKLFYNSMGIVFTNLGQLLSSYALVINEDTAMYQGDIYKTTMTIYCICQALVLPILFLNRQLTARQNKNKLSYSTTEVYDLNHDLTDRENKKFIYKL